MTPSLVRYTAGSIRGVGSLYFGGSPICVHKNAALFVGRFEPVGDAHAEEAFLVVVEDNTVEGLESDDLVDGTGVIAARKNIARCLIKDRLVLSGNPGRLDDQFTGIGAALGGQNLL